MKKGLIGEIIMAGIASTIIGGSIGYMSAKKDIQDKKYYDLGGCYSSISEREEIRRFEERGYEECFGKESRKAE